MRISRDADQWARLESEYKGQLDFQSKMVQARRDGEEIGEKRGVEIGLKKRGAEIMDLIARGAMLEDLKIKLGVR